jgi:hypothetical protein
MNRVGRVQHYSLDHAIVLMQMYGYKSGLLYLYEKAKLCVCELRVCKTRGGADAHLSRYPQMVQHYMDNGEHGELIATCKKYGCVWNAAVQT